MINTLGVLFLLGGVAGIAGGVFPSGSWHGLTLASGAGFIVDAVYIAVGLGLLRRKPLARTLAMGIFLVGSFAFLFVPAFLVLGDALESARAVFGIAFLYLGMPAIVAFLEKLPAIMAIIALLLAGFSAVSFLLYRYLRRQELADEFGGNGPAGASGLGVSRGANPYLFAAVFAVLAFLPAATRIVGERIERASESARSRAVLEAKQIDQVQFSPDNRSLVAASAEADAELIISDLVTGKSSRKEHSAYRMIGTDVNDLVKKENLRMLVSDDNRSFFARTRDGFAITDMWTDQRRKLSALEWPDARPIGFRGGSDFYIFFVPLYLSGPDTKGGTVNMVDARSDRIVYSTPASTPELMEGPRGHNALPPAIHRGKISQNRNVFAYVFAGRLHVASLETGELSIADEPVDDEAQLNFSRESDAIVVNRYATYETGPDSEAASGLVYDIAGKRATRSIVRRGTILHFSSASGAVVIRDIKGVSEFSLADLSTPKWRIELAASGAAVSGNGRFLCFLDGMQKQLECIDLDRVRAGEAPLRKVIHSRIAPESHLFPLQLVGRDDSIVVVGSPWIEIIPLNQPETGKSTLVDLRVSAKR